ncbi:hypothetical protein B0H12DRAFT_818201 [Mycena haematopus]|nr:hypothetical protein B0H12DRAFT_818201 [Mycena haematopus]
MGCGVRLVSYLVLTSKKKILYLPPDAPHHLRTRLCPPSAASLLHKSVEYHSCSRFRCFGQNGWLERSIPLSQRQMQLPRLLSKVLPPSRYPHHGDRGPGNEACLRMPWSPALRAHVRFYCPWSTAGHPAAAGRTCRLDAKCSQALFLRRVGPPSKGASDGKHSRPRLRPIIKGTRLSLSRRKSCL